LRRSARRGPSGGAVAAAAWAPIEGLEARRLLSGSAPVAVGDSLSTKEDTPVTLTPGVTSLYFNSQPGDYIGGGIVKTWTQADGRFSASRNYDNGVSLSYNGNGFPSGDWWYLDFAAPQNATLAPGLYDNATRFPFQAATSPGLSVSGNGRGSNELTGKFTVLQANYAADGTVLNYAADFEQHSEGGTPALFGTIKYNYVAPGYKSGLLNNDSDAEGDALTARLVSGPANGTLALNADGTLTYTPNADFNGTDSFTYVANDGTKDSNVATVTIAVGAVNDAPSFTKGANQTVAEDAGPQTVAGWAKDISVGPANEAAQKPTFVVTTSAPSLFKTQPAIDPATGALTYEAKPDIAGTATVTVVLKDSGGTANGGVDATAGQTFTITVTPVNDAPRAANDAFSVYVGQTLTLAPKADSTRLVFDSQPGDYIGQGIKKTWTTANGTFGASGSTSNNRVGVNFSGGNDWWYLNFSAPYSNPLVPGTYTGAMRDPFRDFDKPGLSVTGNGRGSNTLTGQFTVRQAVFAPDGKIERFAADFEQHSEGMTPALFGTIEYNYRELVGVLVNDTDPDTTTLTAALVSGPAHGALTFNPDGSFSYTPEVGFEGADSFTYKANDGQADSNVATVTINVARPAPPVAKAGGPYSVPEGGTVALSAAGTTSPAGAITKYEWDFDYDGTTFDADATGAAPTFSAAGLDGPSSRTVALRVTDFAGQTSVATGTVSVANVAPTLRAVEGGSGVAGREYTVALSATDPGRDTVSTWVVDWKDGSPVETLTGAAVTASHVYAIGGSYAPTFTATDEDTTVTLTKPVVIGARPPELGADGTLTIYGTAGNDAIGVSTSGGQIMVTVGNGGAAVLFDPAAVQRVAVLGLAGNDAVTLGGALPGGSIDLGGGADTLTLQAGGRVGATFAVAGGDGADQVVVNQAAVAAVAFDGGADADTLTFNASNGDDAIALTPGRVTGGGNAADYSNLETLVVAAMAGFDTFAVDLSPAGSTAVAPVSVTVNGGTGNDTFDVATGPAAAAGKQPTFHLVGDSGQADLGNDVFNLHTGVAYASVMPGAGTDTLNYAGTAGDDVVTIDAQAVRSGTSSVGYAAGLESLVVSLLAGNDKAVVLSTKNLTRVHGGEGDDALVVGGEGALGLFANLNGALTVSGDGGTDAVTFNDQAGVGGSYTLTATVFSRVGAGLPVSWSGEALTVHGSKNADTFSVSPSATTPYTIHAGAPGFSAVGGGQDRLTLVLRGVTGGPDGTTVVKLEYTDVDAGRFTFGNRQDITFTGVEAVTDVLPPQVNVSVFVRDIAPQKLRFFFSETVFPSLGTADLVVRNLDTGAVVAPTGYAYDANGNIANFTFATPLPDGNYRATIAAAGVFDAAGNAMAADHAFEFYVLAGDATGDRAVDFDDLVVLAQGYERPGGNYVSGDFTGDGMVDFYDLVVLAQNYDRVLPRPGAGSTTQVSAGAARFEADWARATAAAKVPPVAAPAGAKPAPAKAKLKPVAVFNVTTPIKLPPKRAAAMAKR
jgi:VCBS repeat-containing protein